MAGQENQERQGSPIGTSNAYYSDVSITPMLYCSALIYKLNFLINPILQLLRKMRLPPALIPRKPTAPQRCGLRLSTKRLNQRRLTPPYPHRKLYPVMTRRN
jgi:hypothetical protein